MSNSVSSFSLLMRLFQVDIFVIDCYRRKSMKLLPWDELTDKVDLLFPGLAEDILFHLLLLLIAILKKDCSVLMLNSLKWFQDPGNKSQFLKILWSYANTYVDIPILLENCLTILSPSSKIKCRSWMDKKCLAVYIHIYIDCFCLSGLTANFIKKWNCSGFIAVESGGTKVMFEQLHVET